jgi:hypothetical protein
MDRVCLQGYNDCGGRLSHLSCSEGGNRLNMCEVRPLVSIRFGMHFQFFLSDHTKKFFHCGSLRRRDKGMNLRWGLYSIHESHGKDLKKRDSEEELTLFSFPSLQQRGGRQSV